VASADDESREIIDAIRGGHVDAFVVTDQGEPAVFTLVKAQEALRRSQDRLELAFEASEMGSWEYEFGAGRVVHSLGLDELFGYDHSQPEWSLEDLRGHYLPADRDAFDEAFAHAVEAGKFSFEGRVRRPSGSVSWLRSVGRTYYDDEGRPNRIVGVVTDETARSHSAEALRESEARHRQLADAMPQLVWTAGPDGNLDYLNERSSEYAGFTRHEGSWLWHDAVHPADLAAVAHNWDLSVTRGREFEIEHRLQLRDGSYRWHLTRAVPLRDGDGRITRWVGTSTDIHDRKEGEIALEKARERLEMALAAAEMGTWETDFVRGISTRSLRHDQIFGYDSLRPDWSLEIARRHVLEEDLEAFDRSVEEAGETGSLFHEVRIRRPDGSIRWIYSHGRSHYDETGACVRRSGVIMDITERKEAEEALRQMNDTLEEQVAARTAELEAVRDHFETVFHASPTAAAIMHRRDGRLLDVNAEFAQFFGFTRTEIIGQTMDDLGMWADDNDRRRILRRVLRDQSLRNEEVRVRLRSGHERVVLAAVEPLRLGAEPCALVKFVDISERKTAEAAVRKLSAALTLAEQRERRRLSQVLHDDLQQILFGVEMRAVVLQQSLQGRGAAESENLVEHLDELRDLIAQAVRSTRVLSIELNPPVLRGEGLAAALSWLVRHMEEMHGLAVQVEMDSDLDIPFEEQRILVVQMARELLFNVVKHSGVRRAVLGARMRDGFLRVRVEDAGSGFDISNVRASSDYRDSLGLFSVQERVRLFGGRLEIDSTFGAGTRILIELPLMDTEGGSPYGAQVDAAS
jgi:PAS domain S-box-containing protein